MPGDSNPRRAFSESGQSMLETAFLLPLLLILALNAINLGYFFFVAVNLAAAPRQGVEYSIQGFATPATLELAKAGPACTGAGSGASVSTLTYHDMIGVLPAPATPCPNIASVQVCTKVLGLNNPGTASQTAQCSSYGPATSFPAPAPDPESPFFVLHRVDVKYTVPPLIAAGPSDNPLNLVLMPTLTFHRQVSMRAMD